MLAKEDEKVITLGYDSFGGSRSEMRRFFRYFALCLPLLSLSVINGANSDEKLAVFTVEIRPSSCSDFNFLISLFL